MKKQKIIIIKIFNKIFVGLLILENIVKILFKALNNYFNKLLIRGIWNILISQKNKKYFRSNLCFMQLNQSIDLTIYLHHRLKTISVFCPDNQAPMVAIERFW
jgi:hypothetical protein